MDEFVPHTHHENNGCARIMEIMSITVVLHVHIYSGKIDCLLVNIQALCWRVGLNLSGVVLTDLTQSRAADVIQQLGVATFNNSSQLVRNNATSLALHALKHALQSWQRGHL
jgi:dethiobiotin synthetase